MTRDSASRAPRTVACPRPPSCPCPRRRQPRPPPRLSADRGPSALLHKLRQRPPLDPDEVRDVDDRRNLAEDVARSPPALDCSSYPPSAHPRPQAASWPTPTEGLGLDVG